MKKFRFKLARLEEVKETELDRLRMETAGAERALSQAQQDLASARLVLEQTYDELSRLRQKQSDPLILLSLESYTSILRESIRKCSQAVLERSRELSDARERLTGKHREKKLIEKVRERKFTEYSLYLDRETQKELDETAKNAHNRNNDTSAERP